MQISNKTFPIQEELSCYTDTTIYSLTCTKGSGTFIKTPGKQTKVFPQTGASNLDGKHTGSFPRDGGPKIMSCTRVIILDFFGDF